MSPINLAACDHAGCPKCQPANCPLATPGNSPTIEIECSALRKRIAVVPLAQHPANRILPYVAAVDFDGTLFARAWPNVGTPNLRLVTAVARAQSGGVWVVLHTCRHNGPLMDALRACADVGLTPDGVNESHPTWCQDYGQPDKVAADLYIDDCCPARFLGDYLSWEALCIRALDLLACKAAIRYAAPALAAIQSKEPVQ